MVVQNSFWSGNINPLSESEAKAILKLQAQNLRTVTNGIVEATVNTAIEVKEGNGFTDAPNYRHCFEIIAPVLGYQSFTLFCLKQSIGTEFPLTFNSRYWNKEGEQECNNLDSFKVFLKEILSSEKTTTLINSIIAQSS